jgi:hypothetical protein
MEEEELASDVQKIHGTGKMVVHLEIFIVTDLLKEVEDIFQPLAQKN